MNVDYNIARAKAIKIMRFGFGKTIGQMTAISAIACNIGEDELTQLVAISYFIAVKDKVNFYNVLQQEFTKMGVYRNKRKKTLPTDFFHFTDMKQDLGIKQLYNLYRVIGFDLFFRFVPHNNTAKSTLRRWCNNAFGRRKHEKRGSLKLKRKIEKMLTHGAFIRFSKTSSSVYIKSNEGEIRISDHETTQLFFNQNLILSKS